MTPRSRTNAASPCSRRAKSASPRWPRPKRSHLIRHISALARNAPPRSKRWATTTAHARARRAPLTDRSAARAAARLASLEKSIVRAASRRLIGAPIQRLPSSPLRANGLDVRESACAAARASGAWASACATSRRGRSSLRNRRTMRRSTSWTSASDGPGRARKRRFPAADEDVVRDHAMKVHVEVEGATESLHESDGARSRPSCSGPSCATALQAEDGRAGQCRACA
jgi:hypothetical protein